MNRARLVFIALFPLSVLLSGCGGESDSTEKMEPQSMEARLAEIAEEEAKFNPNGDMSEAAAKASADRMVKLYQNFVTAHSKEKSAPEFLFKAAKLDVGLGEYAGAIRLLDRLISDYPAFETLPEAMLFKAFICEVHMNNFADAVKAYEALIERFPNHRLAQDAKASIENMTLSDEELIQKFEQQNKGV